MMLSRFTVLIGGFVDYCVSGWLTGEKKISFFLVLYTNLDFAKNAINAFNAVTST